MVSLANPSLLSPYAFTTNESPVVAIFFPRTNPVFLTQTKEYRAKLLKIVLNEHQANRIARVSLINSQRPSLGRLQTSFMFDAYRVFRNEGQFHANCGYFAH